MAVAVFSEYQDNAIFAMGPMSSSSSYNQDDTIVKVETPPPDMNPSVQDFFASFASLERKETTTLEKKFSKIVEDRDGKLKAIDKYETGRVLERRSMEANTDKLRDGAWKLLGISLGIEEISRRDTNTLAMKLGELRRMRRVESLYSGQQQIGDGLRQMVEKLPNLHSVCICMWCQPSTPPTPAPQVDIEENALQIFIKSQEMKIRTRFNAIPREEAARAVKSMKESVGSL